METTKKEELISTRVQRTSNGKYNIIDKQGKPLSEEWKWIGNFDPGTGLARVQREDSKYNYIDKEGKILSEQQWFEWIDDEFHCDKARVRREDGLMNFITKQGKLLSDEWFRYADYFRYSSAFQTSFASVDRTNGESAIIDKNGNIEMEEKKLRVIKAYEQEYLYVIVNESEITFNGNLFDCKYNGLSLSHAEIGDYSFGQNDFDKDLKEAIKEAFNLDMSLDGLVIDECSLDIHTYDAEEEEELSKLIETKGDEIRKFADEWAEKNESLVKGDYIEYWDGSNWDTIVLRSDVEDYSTRRDYELLDEDDEEAIKVLQEFAAKELIDEDFYGKRYRSQEYEFYISKDESWGIIHCVSHKR